MPFFIFQIPRSPCSSARRSSPQRGTAVRRHGGLHRGQVIELVDHSNVQIFDAGLAVYALRLRCPSAPIRPPLSMILFRSTALQPASYIPCCISVDSEPSFLASCFSFSIYWLFEFPMSTFIVQHQSLNFQNIITTAANKAGSEFEALIFMAKRCGRCLRMGKALLRFCSIYDKMCTHLHYILSHKFL